MQDQKVLVIGSGGREHCLAGKIAESPLVSTVYCSPGNGGTRLASSQNNDSISKIKTIFLKLSPESEFSEICEFCKTNSVELVVVGPEDPLCHGVVDALQNASIDCFGPSKAAAALEGSKSYSKHIMQKYGIPTAQYRSFKGLESLMEAEAYAEDMWNNKSTQVVIKASGLAAGKGVCVPKTLDEAIDAIRSNLQGRLHGESSEEIIIEECLQGLEVSVLALTDGVNVAVLPASHDYKRAFTNDQGPNTGGMGAVCPSPRISPQLFEEITETIIKPTIDAMKKEEKLFRGCLYTGIMLTKNGPKVLEYNVRFGDPETQATVPLIESDLYLLMKACSNSKVVQLKDYKIAVKPNTVAVTVVMASGGYPGPFAKGEIISGLLSTTTASKGVQIFQAGTVLDETGCLKTSGGRVLAVTAISSSIEEARKQAYSSIEQIKWKDCYFRTDIGLS